MNFHISPALPTGSLFPAPPPLDLDSDPPSITTTQISPIQEPVSTPDLPIVPSNNPPPFPIRHSTRLHKAPAYLKDFHCKMASTSPLSSSNFVFPIEFVISYNHLSFGHKALTLAISSATEPSSYAEAKILNGRLLWLLK